MNWCSFETWKLVTFYTSAYMQNIFTHLFVSFFRTIFDKWKSHQVSLDHHQSTWVRPWLMLLPNQILIIEQIPQIIHPPSLSDSLTVPGGPVLFIHLFSRIDSGIILCFAHIWTLFYNIPLFGFDIRLTVYEIKFYVL